MALTKQKTNRRTLQRGPQYVVDRGEVEAELAGVLGLKLTRLQFNRKVAMEPYMVEEEVHIEGPPVHLEWDLAADKGETPAQFQEKISEVELQPAFDLAFMRSLRDSQEIEGCRGCPG